MSEISVHAKRASAHQRAGGKETGARPSASRAMTMSAETAKTVTSTTGVARGSLPRRTGTSMVTEPIG